MIKRFFAIFIPGIVIAFAVLGYFLWYYPATTGMTEDPYDEMFITINGFMPQSARNWACDALHGRFSGALAPHTCQDVWGPDLP